MSFRLGPRGACAPAGGIPFPSPLRNRQCADDSLGRERHECVRPRRPTPMSFRAQSRNPVLWPNESIYGIRLPGKCDSLVATAFPAALRDCLKKLRPNVFVGQSALGGPLATVLPRQAGAHSTSLRASSLPYNCSRRVYFPCSIIAAELGR